MTDTRLTDAEDGAVATIALDDGRADVLSSAMPADIGVADRAETAVLAAAG